MSNVDVHVLCGTVKDFLRSLREPLILRTYWHDFVRATEILDPEDAQAALYQAISELPQPNRDTLAALILHLQQLVFPLVSRHCTVIAVARNVVSQYLL